jgi:hypothetical protein
MDAIEEAGIAADSLENLLTEHAGGHVELDGKELEVLYNALPILRRIEALGLSY